MHTIANAINKTQDLNIIDKLKSCNRIKTTIKFKGIRNIFIIVDRAFSKIMKNYLFTF